MTALVLPTDNVVIDYSIIAQIVAVLNQQQTQINNILGVQTAAATAGGGTYPIHYGEEIKPTSGSTATSFTVNLPKGGMTGANIKSIVATAFTGGGAPAKCWIHSRTPTTIVFATEPAVKSMHYILYGIA